LELIQLVEDKPMYFAPGEGWHYSDTNYVLAGMIISAVTGHSVEEELKARFFQPLHLNHTYYLLSSPPDYLRPKMAHGYELRDNNPPVDATYLDLSMADAAGAIISSAHDTAIWFKTLLTTNTVLSAKQRTKLMTLVDKNGQPTSGSGSGLGIFRDYNQYGEEVWSHTGGTPGYRSAMLWLKSQNIVVTMLINSNNNEARGQLWDELVNYIHDVSRS
jgi:D-alanyl-D-alanine carboxypeptidase